MPGEKLVPGIRDPRGNPGGMTESFASSFCFLENPRTHHATKITKKITATDMKIVAITGKFLAADFECVSRLDTFDADSGAEAGEEGAVLKGRKLGRPVVTL